MGTQKTGKGGMTQPPKQVGPKDDWKTSSDEDVIDARGVSSPDEDLGLRSDEAFEPDPKGFEPSSQNVEEVAGRKMIPLGKEDLSTLHKTHAPNESMVPDPFREMSDRKIDPRSKAFNDEVFDDAETLARQQVPHHIQSDKVAEDLLSEFAPSSDPEEAYQQRQPRSRPKVDQSEIGSSEPAMAANAGNMEEAARILEALVRKANQARRDGDLKTAAELTTIAQKIVASSNLKRQQIKKERHPALRKLLSNLGLEKIKHTDVEWLGSTWRFAARPAPLDYWLGANTGPEGLELNAAIIAAGLVGLDDEEGVMHPIWKVHNISLTASYGFEIPGPDEDLPPVTEEVNIPVYHKICDSCSIEIPVGTEECEVCGASLDPYDLPVELRIRCAESTFKLLTEKLCLDAIDLSDLVNKYREVMPDRKFDKEEVFPFVKLLPKRETTLT